MTSTTAAQVTIGDIVASGQIVVDNIAHPGIGNGPARRYITLTQQNGHPEHLVIEESESIELGRKATPLALAASAVAEAERAVREAERVRDALLPKLTPELFPYEEDNGMPGCPHVLTKAEVERMQAGMVGDRCNREVSAWFTEIETRDVFGVTRASLTYDPSGPTMMVADTGDYGDGGSGDLTAICCTAGHRWQTPSSTEYVGY